MKQQAMFWDSEADGWFERGAGRLRDPAKITEDPVLRMVELLSIKPRQVLEVGAANGYRLEAMRQILGCECHGIEPSQKAVEDGNTQFPAVYLGRGLASEIAYPDGAFDTVILAGVLTVIDRATLLRSVAETDRVLCDGGVLLLSDFLPCTPQKVRYHHRPDEEVWTFKQDYAALFLSSCLYEPMAMLTFDFHEHVWGTGEAGNRFMVTALRKNLHGVYAIAGRDG